MAQNSIVKEKFIQYINGIIDNNKVSHAYLIEVDNYDEDLSYIYSFIKMILCHLKFEELNTSNNPILHQIDTGNYPDISIISSDTSVINKSLIIDLQKEFSNKSLLDGKRIYIIKEAEKLNGFSANTILKFLEEPEDDIIAILVTDNRYHVLDTILSRCQVLSLKEDTFSYEINDHLIDFLDCILRPNQFFLQYNHYMKEVFLEKSSMISELNIIENILLSYLEGNVEQEEIINLLSSKDSREIIRIISIIEDEVPKLEFNLNFKLWVDSLFSKLIGG